MILWQLENIGIFNSDQLAGLVEMWRKSHARVYSYYQLSAYAYFQYLQLFDGVQVSCIQNYYLGNRPTCHFGLL